MSDHSASPPRSPTPSFSPPPPDHDFEAPSAAPPPPERAVSPFPELAAEPEADEGEGEDVPMVEEEAAPPASAEVQVQEEQEAVAEEPIATAAETEADKAAELERQVFGEDSDLSSDDDHEPPRQQQTASKRKSPSASRSPSRSRSPSAGPSEDEEAGGNYSDGEDADAKEKKLKFKKSKDKKKKQKATEGDEEAAPKKKKRKTAPAPVEQEDNDDGRSPPPMDEATERRLKLNRKIDEIVRAPKNKRKQSKRADGEDVLDEMNDDLIASLRTKMIDAAEKDEEAVSERRPASAKLRMLREVMSVLQQSTVSQSIVDNDLLSAVKRWLEPLPDKSLPALDIQNSFFDILVKMTIDTDTLKASGLGKIILFYSKSLRSTAHVKRQASDLLAAWSRPIIKRSSSFRTKSVPTMDIRRDRDDGEGGSQGQSQSQGGKKAWERQEGEKIDKKRRNVRIPAPSSTTYTHAPLYNQVSSAGQGSGSGETSQAQQKRTREMERLKKMKKLLADARTAERL